MHWPPFFGMDDDLEGPELPAGGIDRRPPANWKANKRPSTRRVQPQPETSTPSGIWGVASRLLGGARRGPSTPTIIARRRSG